MNHYGNQNFPVEVKSQKTSPALPVRSPNHMNRSPSPYDNNPPPPPSRKVQYMSDDQESLESYTSEHSQSCSADNAVGSSDDSLKEGDPKPQTVYHNTHHQQETINPHQQNINHIQKHIPSPQHAMPHHHHHHLHHHHPQAEPVIESKNYPKVESKLPQVRNNTIVFHGQPHLQQMHEEELKRQKEQMNNMRNDQSLYQNTHFQKVTFTDQISQKYQISSEVAKRLPPYACLSPAQLCEMSGYCSSPCCCSSQCNSGKFYFHSILIEF